MLVEIKENPFIQIEGNFHMKLQCFREKGGFIDQKGRRSIAGLGSVTPRPIHSPRTFAVDSPQQQDRMYRVSWMKSEKVKVNE